jgi:hypothetical protein
MNASRIKAHPKRATLAASGLSTIDSTGASAAISPSSSGPHGHQPSGGPNDAGCGRSTFEEYDHPWPLLLQWVRGRSEGWQVCLDAAAIGTISERPHLP